MFQKHVHSFEWQQTVAKATKAKLPNPYIQDPRDLEKRIHCHRPKLWQKDDLLAIDSSYKAGAVG